MKNAGWKQCLIVAAIVLSVLRPSSGVAFEWSAEEYVERCSVVHQKVLSPEDREIVAYCMGVLKGVVSGLMLSSFIEKKEVEFFPCFSELGPKKFVDIQKDVLAVMRLDIRDKVSAYHPNTANAAVGMALIKLYPCLLDGDK